MVRELLHICELFPTDFACIVFGLRVLGPGAFLDDKLGHERLRLQKFLLQGCERISEMPSLVFDHLL